MTASSSDQKASNLDPSKFRPDAFAKLNKALIKLKILLNLSKDNRDLSSFIQSTDTNYLQNKNYLNIFQELADLIQKVNEIEKTIVTGGNIHFVAGSSADYAGKEKDFEYNEIYLFKEKGEKEGNYLLKYRIKSQDTGKFFEGTIAERTKEQEEGLTKDQIDLLFGLIPKKKEELPEGKKENVATTKKVRENEYIVFPTQNQHPDKKNIQDALQALKEIAINRKHLDRFERRKKSSIEAEKLIELFEKHSLQKTFLNIIQANEEAKDWSDYSDKIEGYIKFQKITSEWVKFCCNLSTIFTLRGNQQDANPLENPPYPGADKYIYTDYALSRVCEFITQKAEQSIRDLIESFSQKNAKKADGLESRFNTEVANELNKINLGESTVIKTLKEYIEYVYLSTKYNKHLKNKNKNTLKVLEDLKKVDSSLDTDAFLDRYRQILQNPTSGGDVQVTNILNLVEFTINSPSAKRLEVLQERIRFLTGDKDKFFNDNLVNIAQENKEDHSFELTSKKIFGVLEMLINRAPHLYPAEGFLETSLKDTSTYKKLKEIITDGKNYPCAALNAIKTLLESDKLSKTKKNKSYFEFYKILNDAISVLQTSDAAHRSTQFKIQIENAINTIDKPKDLGRELDFHFNSARKTILEHIHATFSPSVANSRARIFSTVASSANHTHLQTHDKGDRKDPHSSPK